MRRRSALAGATVRPRQTRPIDHFSARSGDVFEPVTGPLSVSPLYLAATPCVVLQLLTGYRRLVSVARRTFTGEYAVHGAVSVAHRVLQYQLGGNASLLPCLRPAGNVGPCPGTRPRSLHIASVFRRGPGPGFAYLCHQAEHGWRGQSPTGFLAGDLGTGVSAHGTVGWVSALYIHHNPGSAISPQPATPSRPRRPAVRPAQSSPARSTMRTGPGIGLGPLRPSAMALP